MTYCWGGQISTHLPHGLSFRPSHLIDHRFPSCLHTSNHPLPTNGGFFIANMFSFMEPTPVTLTTSDKLKPYGWTTTDTGTLCAPP
ncbi:hypothetical protein BDR07DRAFT_1391304 [Suillus spraguei]|nr:hypothetical protein BDR07DRAFT_1391304 [Suillus spraguei]